MRIKKDKIFLYSFRLLSLSGPLAGLVGLLSTFRPSTFGLIFGFMFGVGLCLSFFPSLIKNKIRDVPRFKESPRFIKIFFLFVFFSFCILDAIFIVENGLHRVLGKVIEKPMYVATAGHLGRSRKIVNCKTRIILSERPFGRDYSLICVSENDYLKLSNLVENQGVEGRVKYSFVLKNSVFGTSFLGLSDS